MEHAVTAELSVRQTQQGVADFGRVTPGYGPTHGVVGVKIPQLDAQHGGLQLVQAAVTPAHAEHILALRTVIAQRTDRAGQLGVVSGDGPGVAQGAEVLARIKAVAGCVAQAARALSSEHAAVGLRVVLYKLEPVAAADVGYAVRIGATAVQVDYHHGARARRYGPLYKAVVYLQRVLPRLHEHRAKAVFAYGQYAGDIRIGRHNHLVAGLHHAHLDVGAQDKRERIESVAATYAVFRPYVPCVFFLEEPVFLALQIPSAVNDAPHRSVDFIGMHGRNL